jgi:hypothetical protein
MGGIFQWPGPVHEGRGKCQPFVDERADGEQREALLKIMSGQDTEPMATMFAVFSSTLEKVYDPIFAKIDFNVDVEGRRGRYTIAGLIESAGEPIKNPVTGARPGRVSTCRTASNTRSPRLEAVPPRHTETSNSI